MTHRRTVNLSSIAAALVAIGMLLAGCTTTTVKPSLAKAPQESYQNVAVGEITSADPLWQSRLVFLRRGLVDALSADGQFQQIMDPVPSPIPPNTVLVSGNVTEVDKGNKALRFIVGFGAGAAGTTGEFQLHDDDGTRLAAFEAHKAYAGGAGIGGVDFMDMDDLMEELGREVAASVIRWTRGKTLE